MFSKGSQFDSRGSIETIQTHVFRVLLVIAGSLTLVVTACGTAGTASPGKMAPYQAITGSAARKADPRHKWVGSILRW